MGLLAIPVGVSQLAWFRVFASDKSGAVSIEFVVLVASLMGVGTLSAVTVQSGALVRAGIIGDNLEEATTLARGTNLPINFPEIGPSGPMNLPGDSTQSADATGGSGPVTETVVVHNGGGGVQTGGGSGTNNPDCLVAEPDPELGPLDCDEQAADTPI